MNILKTRIISGSIGGLVFAIVMALFDYFDSKEFNLLKFVISSLIFGIFMFILVKTKNKKEKKC